MKTKMIHYIEVKLLKDLPPLSYFILADDYDKENARVYMVLELISSTSECKVIYIGGGTRDDDSHGITEVLSRETKVHSVSIKGITFAV